MGRFDHITTREQMERPAALGGMSMGEGRRLTPENSGGTMFNGCPKSPRPDGKHEFTAVSMVQSVEHFVCDFGCGEEWYD